MAFGQYSGGVGAVVGGIIGAVVGYQFGMAGQGAALGMSIGGAAGGIAGQVFWPEKIDAAHPTPPKPVENRVQISTYGSPIPIQYDDGRMAGNIIYMSDIKKTVDTYTWKDDQLRYHTYTTIYTATFAIAFCENPNARELARIWVNGKVFVDYRDPDGPYYPTAGAGYAVGNLETSIARAETYYAAYLGNEVQYADGTLSGLLVASETPAYRGICYIVFIDFPVGEFSGIPAIEIELAAIATMGT